MGDINDIDLEAEATKEAFMNDLVKAYSSNHSSLSKSKSKVSDVRRKFTTSFHPNFLDMNIKIKHDNAVLKAKQYEKIIG